MDTGHAAVSFYQNVRVCEDLVVTNAEIEGVQVIATSFHIAIDGVVRKTQRLLVKIKENFDGKEFPYDTQARFDVLKNLTKLHLLASVARPFGLGVIYGGGRRARRPSGWEHLGLGRQVLRQVRLDLPVPRAQDLQCSYWRYHEELRAVRDPRAPRCLALYEQHHLPRDHDRGALLQCLPLPGEPRLRHASGVFRPTPKGPTGPYSLVI